MYVRLSECMLFTTRLQVVGSGWSVRDCPKVDGKWAINSIRLVSGDTWEVISNPRRYVTLPLRDEFTPLVLHHKREFEKCVVGNQSVTFYLEEPSHPLRFDIDSTWLEQNVSEEKWKSYFAPWFLAGIEVQDVHQIWDRETDLTSINFTVKFDVCTSRMDCYNGFSLAPHKHIMYEHYGLLQRILTGTTQAHHVRAQWIATTDSGFKRKLWEDFLPLLESLQQVDHHDAEPRWTSRGCQRDLRTAEARRWGSNFSPDRAIGESQHRIRTTIERIFSFSCWT